MRSLYFLISLGLCLLLTNSQESSQSTTLCNTSAQNLEDNQIDHLGLNTTSVTQETCVKYFELSLQNDQFQNKYLHIEISFTNLPKNPGFTPIVAEKVDEIPALSNSGLRPSNMQNDGVTIDYNAFVNHKAYANLVVSPQDISQGNIAYFAVYNIQSERVGVPLEYQVKVSVADSFPCPQDCSNHGSCNEEQQKCICNIGFFDLDCSVEATLLSETTPITEPAGLGQWKYFYTPDDEFTQGYDLTISKTGVSTLFILTTFNGPDDFNLVNYDNAQDKFYLFYDKTAKLSVFNGNSNDVDGQVLIGVFSREATTITLSLEEQDFDSDEQDPVITSTSTNQDVDTQTNSPVYATTSDYSYDKTDPPVLEIVFIAIGVFIAICVCGALLKRAETQRIMRYEAAQRTHTHEGRQEPPANVLTKEDFEKYFPKKKYKDIEDPFNYKTCSVCLDDFEEEIDCHQLYCKHVFHVDCIEAWLAKHDSCPNCKKNMTKSAIEEFFKSQEVQVKEIKEEPSLVLAEEKKEDPKDVIVLDIDNDNPSPDQDVILFPIQENMIAPSHDNVAPSQDNLMDHEEKHEDLFRDK